MHRWNLLNPLNLPNLSTLLNGRDALPGSVAYLDLVRRALAEDIGPGDLTTRAIVPAGVRARARFIAKATCVVAGLDVASAVFTEVDPAIRCVHTSHDGDLCQPDDVLSEVQGPAASILTAERTALNFLQHLSGIATLTRRFVDAAHRTITILDTRKTVPTLRALAKYAVRCGGGANHRIGLYDAVLIKDNHIRVAGTIGEAVRRVRASGTSATIEVETQSLDEVDAAIEACADIIMLDNLDDATMRDAIRRIAGRARVEISGRVTLERLQYFGAIGADCVSVGALTHSAPAADISLEIESEKLPADLASAITRASDRLGPFANLSYLAETDSTNDIALTWAAAGAAEGVAVIAERQTAGRGRRGRVWFSPPGAGVYLSVIVRPGPFTGPLSVLTLVAGVAVAHAVTSTTGLPVELKWPNDLVIGRPWRKVGGLLCESTGAGSQVDAVVIGIGVNVLSTAYPSEIGGRATAIETELGRAIERAPIVVECLAQLRAGVERLREEGSGWVGVEWRRFGQAGLGGAAVSWHDQSGERRGIARDLDEAGALVVESDGRVERLIAGEVRWERLSHD